MKNYANRSRHFRRAAPFGLLALLVMFTGSAAVANVSSLTTVEIQTIDLRETPTGTELTLEGDGPLVWTQYRDEAGDLVVELPNTVLDGSVLPPAPRGLVASVSLEPESNGTRPMTRLVVSTTRQAEHTLYVDQGLLTLSFDGSAPTVLAQNTPSQTVPAVYEEAVAEPSPEPAAPASEPAPAVLQDPVAEPGTPVGTPEQPVQGPEPDGVRATRLFGVVVTEAGGVPALRIEGDGEFEYSTFRLANPPRFVIDLQGVVNSASQTRVDVGDSAIQQVRMAQFRPYPDPVTRIVLDLNEDTMPALQPVSEGLMVSFPSAAALMTDSEPAAEEAMPEAEQEIASGGPQTVPALGESTDPAQEAADESAEEMADAAAEPVYAEPEAELAQAEPEFAEESVAAEEEPVFAEDEPLQITDDTRRESPTSDVSLFEAQQVEIAPNQVLRNNEPQGFAVQRLDEESRWVGEPITLTVKDADLAEVLRTIARYAELNLIVQPGVSIPISIEFIGVPWDQALDQILKMNRLDKQLEGNILRIARKDLFREEAVEDQQLAAARALSVPLSTVIKRLSYADAQDVSRILTRGQQSQGSRGAAGPGLGIAAQDTGILSQRGSVNVDDRTNTLIIKELPDYLDTVIQVIENLDIPEKQVMIEARVVETSRNFSRSLGIDWSFGGAATAATGNTTGLQFPNRVETGGGVQLLTGGDNGFFNLSLGNVLNTFQLDLALQAAESEGLVNVISSPKIATLNNSTAQIETGLQLPVQTVTGGGGTTAGGLVNPFGTVSVNFVRASLRLQVTPQVTFEGTILLSVRIEKDEPQFALQVPGSPSAPISTRRAETRVRVADGGTAVIGGIYQVTTNEGEDRVPGLARIPILGQLFKNRDQQNSNQELLIFITPRVIQQ